MEELDASKYTPMMQQYIEIKKDYADAIVFFRLGDFYEMFFKDAFIASRELELALTGKDAGAPERVPMCGIPYHAYLGYVDKLISKGYKVVIVEQMEDPSLAKGIVKRGIVKIVTPGTVVDSFMNEKENNYLVCAGSLGRQFVLAYADVSTGESYCTTVDSIELLANEIIGLKAKEIIVSSDFEKRLADYLHNNIQIVISIEDKVDIPADLMYMVDDIEDCYYPYIGMLLNYILGTQLQELKHMQKVIFYTTKDYLRLDPFTKRNLELTETLRHNQKNGSLLWHIDKCQTAMGSRMLHKLIDQPLVDKAKINERLDFVQVFNQEYVLKEEIRESLKSVYDIERIIGRISCGNANAKDLVQLRRTLGNIPYIKDHMASLPLDAAKALSEKIDCHNDLFQLLQAALVDNPPLTIKDGGMIASGYNNELDEIKDISKNSKDWILNFEAAEKEKTGIKTLKVGYNRVFGYYIEISKGQIGLIPENSSYDRKQTLANSERYITPELKHYEQIIINAKDRIESLEYELFLQVRNETAKYINSLQELAYLLAMVDCYISFSEVAMKYNYVRPTFNDNRSVNIVDGRHPVMETLLHDAYVTNDVVINKYNMVLITGPNMSGKSTYMRMLADIAILAQIGSFVPAKSADLMIFDQIFTRIGASDDLLSGQSTFMVEMMEANYALANATKNSLILFDEIGRGTATFDGMALAQAILEYVHEKIGAITLFSTHYHELVQLEDTLNRLKNVHVEAKETKNGVAFLHKVSDGPIDKSYGINVASLAGLPRSLIERSKQILTALETTSDKKAIKLDLFNFDAYEAKPEVKEETAAMQIKKDLELVDVNRLTPIEALNFLSELKSRLD